MLNSPKWLDSTGAPVAPGALLAVGTYTYEIPLGVEDDFGVTLESDAALTGTATLEACDASASVHSAASPTGWLSYAASLGTVTFAAAATTLGWSVCEWGHLRARVVLVVTGPGVCDLYPTVKGN